MTGLVLDSVVKTYRRSGHPAVKALQDFSWEIPSGQISGLVGESGSGKSTLVHCIVGLETPDAGSIHLGDTVLHPRRGERPVGLRRQVQLVFQDPTASLNPRMTAGQLIGEGLLLRSPRPSSAMRHERVSELMELVGLDPHDAVRYPRSFSGGQRQRIAIARAVAVGPDVLVCDEPVSALDVSVQAQVLGLMRDLQQRLGLTILFVAHDLAVVRQLCTQVAVLVRGRLVEQGPTSQVLSEPNHSYTQSLVAAALVPDPVLARQAMRQRRRVQREPTSTTSASPREQPTTSRTLKEDDR